MPANSGSEKSEMTFFDHLDALRKNLVRIVLAILIFTILAFIFKDIIFDDIIFGPKDPDFPTNQWFCSLGLYMDIPELCINKLSFNTINTDLSGQFRLHLMVSLIAGLILAFPYLIWELWRFIKPALKQKEIEKFKGFISFASILFFIGIFFGYFIISPLTINFLFNYEASSQITNLIDIDSYLTTIITLVLVSGLIFELPVLIFLLSNLGVLTPEFLRKYRRHSIVVIFIVAAIITPPDVFSQVLVGLPLVGLYEFGIGISARVQRKRNSS
ncbi:MAG: twin arginine-targeting protein translocase TatC [Bacteroidetes bacterium GWF2_38_335]|nr:MAG: twin arginine-targeting protein translocase TatC [Bacteroidetes bacterium GWF2_38_335]OFY77459.1 MAG: twin arginine-targeting protein translocase TatC [Bacteroidetes bacterium RIFOXYA12_FULL_38_20]HBS87251.1 twin-arginine translocase subunit TatC [Bacteroidales bacterium]